MKEYFFRVNQRPKPKQSTRMGKGRFHKDPKVEAAEKNIRYQVSQQMETGPITGPVFVTVIFLREAVKTPKWKRIAQVEGRIKKTTIPDVDNLMKLTLDALNGLVWTDDRNVIGQTGFKGYGMKDEILIHVLELPQMENKDDPVKAQDPFVMSLEAIKRAHQKYYES